MLLPTLTNPLLAQWHGPYKVLKQMGKVTIVLTCTIVASDHLNMLQEFYPDIIQQVVGWSEDMEVDMQEKIPVWKAITLSSIHVESG